jgi:hypothetical protein
MNYLYEVAEAYLCNTQLLTPCQKSSKKRLRNESFPYYNITHIHIMYFVVSLRDLSSSVNSSNPSIFRSAMYW